jgi:hypothetical protein
MTKELSLIFLFFVLFCMIIFLHGMGYNPIFPFKIGTVLFRSVLNRDTLWINSQN